MILVILEISVVVAVAIYLIAARVNTSRRKRVAWDRLVAQLRPNPVRSVLDLQLSWSPRDGATSISRVNWWRHQIAIELWSMYENARVMLDMANYTAEVNATIDQELLANLRRDAMQIRLLVSLAMTQYACYQVNESVRENAARATILYREMVQRMTELMQANGEVLAPHVA